MIVNKNLFHTIHKSKLCSKCVKNHSLFFNNAEIFEVLLFIYEIFLNVKYTHSLKNILERSLTKIMDHHADTTSNNFV